VTTRVLVAGLGTESRRDDGAGPLVALEVAERTVALGQRRGATVVPLDEPIGLMGRWDGAELAVIVDATHSDSPPGTIKVMELAGDIGSTVTDRLTASRTMSTHGLGVADVLHLARTLERAPRRVVVVGIEGKDFAAGFGLSPAVRKALPQAVAAVLELVSEAQQCA
jgi:hydrogenase maturation protease